MTTSSSTTNLSSLLLLISDKNGNPPAEAGLLFSGCFEFVDVKTGGTGTIVVLDKVEFVGNGGGAPGIGGALVIGAAGLECLEIGLLDGKVGFEFSEVIDCVESDLPCDNELPKFFFGTDGTNGAPVGIGGAEDIGKGGGLDGTDGVRECDDTGIVVDAGGFGEKFIEFLFGLPDGMSGTEEEPSGGFDETCLSFGIPPANISPN